MFVSCLSLLGACLTTFQNLIGDLVLIWRLYVVYGNNWQITILPLLLAFAAEGCTQYGGLVTFINPAKIIAQQKATKAGKTSVVSQVVTAGFSLTAATQLLVTLLLAFKIYTATRSIGQLSDRKASRYSSLIWTLVESGAAMAAGEIIFVAVWQTAHGAAAQLVLAILGQLCALVPFSIFVRIGLRLAFEGKHATYYASSNSVPASGTLQSIQFARSPHTQDESTGQLSEFKERSWGSQNQEV
ncbi:unnamed protein product [Mycena citricolor]|uniref:Uncharacterized protein n=1 Tax=Mycena citricolor TaxID=2018698 RepID=A0AAD2H1P5_9AGAR|nr:unnamed protein product [Mycena citricolor]